MSWKIIKPTKTQGAAAAVTISPSDNIRVNKLARQLLEIQDSEAHLVFARNTESMGIYIGKQPKPSNDTYRFGKNGTFNNRALCMELRKTYSLSSDKTQRLFLITPPVKRDTTLLYRLEK